MIELLLQAERALAVGLLDQAERLYRQAAEQDPRNAIAVVGLARVALERGDEALALTEGLRALEIDPENASASRLVQRLEEIALFRGGPMPAIPPADAQAAPTESEGEQAAAPTASAPEPSPPAGDPRPAPPRWPPAAAEPPAERPHTPVTDGTLRPPASPEPASDAGGAARTPATRKRRSLLGRILRRG